MHRYSRIVEEVLDLLSITQYAALGVVGDKLLVSVFRGVRDVYAFDGSSMVKLNAEPVLGVAEAHYGVDRVVLWRDVSKGRELSKIYVVRIDSPGREVELHPEQRPSRIFGVADDGETVVFSSVHERGVGIYAVRGGKLWKAADVIGVPIVTDVRKDLATGIGIFPPETRYFKLFTVELGSGELRVHQPPVKGNVLLAKVSSSGSVVYALEGAREGKLFELDPDTGKSSELRMERDLARFNPTSFAYLGFTTRGEILVSAKRCGRTRVFLEGEKLSAPTGVHLTVYEWRGKVVVTHSSTTTPPRIVELDREGKEWRPLLEDRGPWWLSEVVEEVGYVEPRSSADGSPVPTHYVVSRRAGKPGPTVVLVHGGPFAEYDDSFNIVTVALAASGFHVVKPNYRGSTGYGVEWTEKIIGDPGGAELEDIVSAADWAEKSGLSSRTYIMGYSYGGYATLCALTMKPGRFRGGVAGASVADWEEMYELSDPAFKQFIEMLFAGRKELWRERSPVTHIDNLRDPLMIVHPLNDTRTPLRPVLKFVGKAAEKGKRIEMYVAPDMGHVINTAEDAMKILLPALLYLARLEERRSPEET